MDELLPSIEMIPLLRRIAGLNGRWGTGSCNLYREETAFATFLWSGSNRYSQQIAISNERGAGNSFVEMTHFPDS